MPTPAAARNPQPSLFGQWRRRIHAGSSASLLALSWACPILRISGRIEKYVFTRWRKAPEAALVPEGNGKFAGSNVATNWGSFGFFGPLTVLPELWKRQIERLLGPTVDLFEKWGMRETGLFTFAHSPKHIGLYQQFGYWPRFLTAIMSKAVTVGAGI
jgi:hypothetical protein